MIGIALRFDLGRYHANPWGAHINEAEVEWPPSPWRILRALFAVSRTNLALARLRNEVDGALVALGNARPPVYELPPSTIAHTRHYMPSRRYSPAKPTKHKDLVIDAFRVLAPEAQVAVWWDADLRPVERRALDGAAHALGFLGRSESVCSAWLIEQDKPDYIGAAPLAEGLVRTKDVIQTDLLCLEPKLGDPLRTLRSSVAEVRAKQMLLPPGTRRVTYEVARIEPTPGRPAAPRQRSTLACFRLVGDSRPSVREAVAVTHGVRAALQAQCGRNGGETSPTFSGRRGDRPRSDQHRHAHYLALPDRGGGRIDHLAVWAPEGFDIAETEALELVRYITLRGAEPLRIVMTAMGGTEDLDIPTLLGPSRSWRSLTPFGLVRHPKRRSNRIVDSPADQIRVELGRRGLPDPLPGDAGVRLVKGSWHEFRRSRPGVSRPEAPSPVGAEIEFPDHVRGPIALGALSHFGLGLFTPW